MNYASESDLWSLNDNESQQMINRESLTGGSIVLMPLQMAMNWLYMRIT